MASILTLDENFIPDLTAYVATIFSDVKLLIIIIIGLALGLWVIGAIVSSLKPEKG